MVRRWLLALALTGGLAVLLGNWLTFRGSGVQAQTEERCFAETSLCISGVIREYWEKNGGIPVFGYPITPQNQETVEGWTGPVQWFERDRLEDHGDQGVMAGRLGARVLELDGRPWEETFPEVTSADAGCQYFEPTGHSLCEPFLSYWRDNGGLERFGYPITEQRTEVITSTDTVFSGTVQYFERRRMELHQDPNNTDQQQVLLGLLGKEVRETQPPSQGGEDTPPHQIAFTSLKEGNQDVYLCDLAADFQSCSNEPKRLTNILQNDGRPAWSPDGTYIALESDKDGDWDVYQTHANGSGLLSLTEGEGNNWVDGNPSWAGLPIGWRVAFHSNRDGNYEIYLVDSGNPSDKGKHEQRLTTNNGIDSYPALAPHGYNIAFVSDRDGEAGELDIFVATLVFKEQSASLSDLKNLTPNLGGICRHPAWSPDGSRILFENETEEGKADIYVVNADGTGEPQNLTNSPDSFDGHPDWSPDGQWIVFQSNRSGQGHFDIYIAEMKSDGLGDPSLVIGKDLGVDVKDPAWRPQRP